MLPLGPEISWRVGVHVQPGTDQPWDGAPGWGKSSFQEPLGWDRSSPCTPWGHRAPLGLGWELGMAMAPGEGAEQLCQPEPTAATLWPSTSQGQEGLPGAGALSVQVVVICRSGAGSWSAEQALITQ